MRNIWVDVPTAANSILGKGKTQAQDRLCQLAGTKVRLPDATLRKLYPNKDEYVHRANRRLDEFVAEGRFLPEYAEPIRRDIQATDIP